MVESLLPGTYGGAGKKDGLFRNEIGAAVSKSHETFSDFTNCSKRLTFWLITSVGKNNYCHMVCGLGFRRIKSLLLFIVFIQSLIPHPLKPSVFNSKPKALPLAKIQAGH